MGHWKVNWNCNKILKDALLFLLLVASTFGNGDLMEKNNQNKKAAENIMNNARRFKTAGMTEESILQYRTALSMEPWNEEIYYELALLHHQVTRDFQEAAVLLDQLLSLASNPDSLLASNLDALHQVLNERALVAWDMQDHQGAVKNFREAIEAKPLDKHSNFNLAAILTTHIFPEVIQSDPMRAAAIMEEAVLCYERSLLGAEGDPSGVSITNILNDYSLTLQKIGRYEQGLEALQKALEIDGDSMQTHANLALLFKEIGRTFDALRHAEISVNLNPENPAVWHNFGLMLQDANQLDHALEAWKMAVLLDPDLTVSLSSIGHTYGSKGNLTAATEYYQRALEVAVVKGERETADSLRLQKATACIPHIYKSNDHIEEVRATYTSNLDEMLATDLLLTDPETSVGCGGMGYYTIYQGYDDRPLRQKLAQIYWKSSPPLRFEAPYLTKLPDHGSGVLKDSQSSSRKIRVGFLSKFFFHHSVGLLTQGVICGLDRKRFNVTTLFLQPQPVDDVSERLMSCSDHTVDAGSSLIAAQLIIAEQELDILVFTEIGMDSLTYFLAFSHLAKRTVFFWGHAITSGIAASDGMLAGLQPEQSGGIDYFVSSVLYETLGKEAQKKYTERLFLMDGLTTSFMRPMAPRAGMTRADFDLEDDYNIYLVPQTLYKLHPDFDTVIRKVLKKDPQGVVVMPEAQQDDWTATLLQRMKDTLQSYLNRVKIIRRMAFDEFQAMARMANVVIDPFPLGGGRSSLEIFSTGTPIVLWYNRTSILQLTFGMYKTMGMENCCTAYNEGTFVEKIVAIGTNRTLENELRSMILDRNSALYEQDNVVEEWEEFLEYVINVPRPLDAAYQKAALVAHQIRGTQVKVSEEAIPISILLDTDISTPTLSDERWVRKDTFGWEALKDSDLSPAEKLKHTEIPTSLHQDLLYAIRLSFPNPYTGLTRSFIIEVWRGQNVHKIAMDFAAEADLDYTQMRWLHRLLERGAKISSNPVVWNQHIHLYDSSGLLLHSFKIIIHKGEDLFQAANWLAYTLRFNNVFINYCFELMQTEAGVDSGSLEWISQRNALIDLSSMPPELRKKWPDDGISKLESASTNIEPSSQCITLGITSSKRLSLFQKTVNSLEQAVGFLPNDIICKVIVIDDASSLEDRVVMMETFPSFEYIIKDPSSRGHANSLNKLVSSVQTQYFMYMEDDWQFLQTSMQVIEDALHILQHTVATAEPIVQVILNDQSCRDEKRPTDYASPDNRCPHRSGWPRELDGIKYRVHEFGIIHPDHDIAYWPGFSLNPAVWNLHEIKKVFFQQGSGLHFNETDRLFESWFSMQVMDAGMRVAFLDEISFRHIGTKDSAYTLNGFERPWDFL